MSLVKLAVNRISYSQSQNGAYALILEEIDGERKLPIVIGGFEAQSIAIALDKEIDRIQQTHITEIASLKAENTELKTKLNELTNKIKNATTFEDLKKLF